MTVLLLNASYEPLMVVSWRRAITLLVTGRAEMVEQSGDQVIRSAGGVEFPRPGVVRLRQMVSFTGMRDRNSVRFSRTRLAIRDDRTCQVEGCDKEGDTIDHVVPRSRGGDTSWENCVLMCKEHNSVKDSRLLSELGWKLKKQPAAPVGAMVFTTAASTQWSRWVAPVS